MPTRLGEQSAMSPGCVPQDCPPSKDDCYIAPVYGKTVVDQALLERINARRPAHIVIALGAGKQEKLGYYLREQGGVPARHPLLGAAIAFLTGDQAPIPMVGRPLLPRLAHANPLPSRSLYIPRYTPCSSRDSAHHPLPLGAPAAGILRFLAPSAFAPRRRPATFLPDGSGRRPTSAPPPLAADAAQPTAAVRDWRGCLIVLAVGRLAVPARGRVYL